MRKFSVGIIIILFLSVMLQGPLVAQIPAPPQLESADKISLDIKGMDILDVFRILSMRAGLNIVAGRNVTGRVTLFLKDVGVWDAFEIIIAANGLAYEKRGNIIYVMTGQDYELNYGIKYQDKRIVKSIKLEHVKAEAVSKAISQLKTNIGRVIADETSDTLVIMDIPAAVAGMEGVIKELDVPFTTKVYSLQYATADKLKDKLSEMLTKNVGSLRIDERTNKIAITDLEEKIPMFDKVISEFDEKHKEVLIEAKILQIALDDEYSMGVNWDGVFAKMEKTLHRVATVGVNLKYSGQSDVIPTTASASAKGGALQIGQLDSEGYQAVIQSLQVYGQTNLLSSPRIAVLNNEEAKILVGTNQPYATRSISQATGGTANVEAENVTFLDLGVKLYVTPTINKDNYITMKIKPEVSSKISDYLIVSSGNLIPVVKTTTTETTVMVKDGATVLIGGLIEDRKEENIKEVPGLSKIPLVGGLFRSKTKGSTSNPEKTELVIFLTPHIITGDEPKGLLTVEKVAQDVAMKKAEIEKGSIDEYAPEKVMVEDMSPQEYYDMIQAAITQHLESHRPSIPVYGKVVVSFVLDNNGRLVSMPKVYKGDNEVLSKIGIKSIQEAAPFPAFPKSIDKKQETFQITISYE